MSRNVTERLALEYTDEKTGERWGFSIMTVQNGKPAFAVYTAHAAHTDSFLGFAETAKEAYSMIKYAEQDGEQKMRSILRAGRSRS